MNCNFLNLLELTDRPTRANPSNQTVTQLDVRRTNKPHQYTADSVSANMNDHRSVGCAGNTKTFWSQFLEQAFQQELAGLHWNWLVPILTVDEAVAFCLGLQATIILNID